jgi:adenine-specific DNA-methyltransferase
MLEIMVKFSEEAEGPAGGPCSLSPDGAKSYGDPGAGNMIIHGDNLPALWALGPMFAGKVKCAYADPPYNTGNDFIHYSDSAGHSDWLGAMASRFAAMKNLLSPDGSLWVSVDDDEGHYLKVALDAIFGRENFVNTVVWEKKYTTANDSRWLSDNHDFILVYAKDKELWRPSPLPRPRSMDAAYRNPDGHPKGAWKPTPLHAKSGSRGAGKFSHVFSNGVEWSPPPGTYPRFSKERLAELEAGGEIWFGKKGNAVPARKTFLSGLKRAGARAKTVWRYDEVGHNHEARAEARAFNGELPFPTPKPERLIERVLSLGSEEGDLVLDAFLGSGTTAAVAHKMGRRYIGIEIGDHCRTHCLPRLRAVVDGERGGVSESRDWRGGGGFKFYEVA